MLPPSTPLRCHIPPLISQKYNLVQLWRPASRFMEANISAAKAIIAKVEEINKGDPIDNGPFRPQLLRENPGLLGTDYREYADWLLAQTKPSFRDMNASLVSARKRRMARWHVYSAPDDVVIPEKKCVTHPHGITRVSH